MSQKPISVLRHYMPEIKRYKWSLAALAAVTVKALECAGRRIH
jgi:hypothetical protein